MGKWWVRPKVAIPIIKGVLFCLFYFILSKRLQKKRRHTLAESSVKIYVDEQNIHCDLIFLHVSLWWLSKISCVVLLFISFTATVVRDELGLTLEKAGKEVLGSAVKVVITKDSTLIITDGSTQNAVNKRVAQIQSLVKVPSPFSLVMMHDVPFL